MSTQNNQILKQVYRKTKIIAKNQLKTIWQVTHLYTGDVAVAKTQIYNQSNANERNVLHQGKFLQSCQGSSGIPFLIWCGKDQIQQLGILIEQKLGKTLYQLKKQQITYKQTIKINKGKIQNTLFSLKSIVMIALQLIKIIACYHQKGYIYRNINLNTIQFGCGSRCDKLYLNDFIDSRSFYKKNTLQHIDKKSNIKLKKINQFMSFDTLNGIEPSRKDDLQSIMYLLLNLSKGELPWSQIFYNRKNNKTKSQRKQSYQLKEQGPTELKNSFNESSIVSKQNLAQKINAYLNGDYGSFKIQKKAQLAREIMSSYTSKQLFTGLPVQFIQIFDDIKKLQFNSKPRYIYYIQKLQAILIKNGWQNDSMYDWMKYDRIRKYQNKGGLNVKQLQWLIIKPKNSNKQQIKNDQQYLSYNKLSKLDKQQQIMKLYQKYAPHIEIDRLR